MPCRWLESLACVFVSTSALFLCACAHVTNSPLCDGGTGPKGWDCYSSSPQTTYRFEPKADHETLVLVSFSGGGTRATALSYGALQMMDTLIDAKGNNLLDQVDVISSVSGGSATAAWYAVNGRAGLEAPNDKNRLWRFLHHDWTDGLAWRVLNPLSLSKFAFTDYQRSDVLADFFAENLIGETTYKDVFIRYRTTPNQPFIVLNASDIGHEIGFDFTQTHFDLLCSDLLHYRIADALAASANFPFAFSPTGIQNYSPCPVQNTTAWQEDGPSKWISHYDDFDRAQHKPPNGFQMFQLRQARQAKAFIGPPKGDKYLHLLDGGLIDNLGVRSALALTDDPARVPGLYLRLGSMRPDGYQNIRRVLFIVVNARNRDTAGIDASMYPPGILTTAKRVIDTELDASILSDQDYLTSELEAVANRESPSSRHPADTPPFLSAKQALQMNVAAPADPLKFYVATVDFDMIPDPRCREYFWRLGTNWGLRDKDIRNLIELSKVLLARSPDLRNFYFDVNGGNQDSIPKLLDPSASFGKACDQM